MLRFYHNLALLNIHWKTTKDKKCRSLHYSFGKNVLANTLTSLLLTSNMPPKNCCVLAFILLSALLGCSHDEIKTLAYITGNTPAEHRSAGQCEYHFKWKTSTDVTQQPPVCDFFF